MSLVYFNIIKEREPGRANRFYKTKDLKLREKLKLEKDLNRVKSPDTFKLGVKSISIILLPTKIIF